MPNGTTQAQKNRLIQNLLKTRKAAHTKNKPKIPFLAEAKEEMSQLTAETALEGLAELGFAGGKRRKTRKTRRRRRSTRRH